MGYKLGQKVRNKYWAGPDYGFQSKESYDKLKASGELKLGASAVRRVSNAIDSRIPQWMKDNIEAERKRQQGGYKPEVYQQPDATSKLISDLSDRTQIARPIIAGGAAAIESLVSGRLSKSMAKSTLRGAARKADVPTAYANKDKKPMRSQREVEELLKGDQYAAAYGPASKQFGAHPLDIANQRAFIDADGPIPGSGGTKGRPSASASSPALRELREGKRKATGLQAVKDRLNQGRSPNPPRVTDKSATKQSTAPRSVSPEQSLRNTQTLEQQIERTADTAIRDRLGMDTRRGTSVPAEAVDFQRRRHGLPSEPDRKPVRRTKDGKVIRESKKESTGTVQGRSIGRKGRPAVSIEERRSGSNPYTKARTKNSPDSGRSTVKGPKNESMGRTFDNTGELRGLTTKGKNASGRSPKQQQQARSTLKSRIEYLRGLPWTQERSRRIQRMQQLLKRIK